MDRLDKIDRYIEKLKKLDKNIQSPVSNDYKNSSEYIRNILFILSESLHILKQECKTLRHRIEINGKH